MSFQITGVLHVKGQTEVKSEKFKKRDFVIKVSDEKYPQVILFQLAQEKCALLDSCNEGIKMTVYFNLRGKEWDGPNGKRYFNTLEAWRIESEEVFVDNKVTEKPSEIYPDAARNNKYVSDEPSEDLPF